MSELDADKKWFSMNLDAKIMVPISEANKDFSRVMHMADIMAVL